MSARPVIAVVPFGARVSDPRHGAWARQLARRLVERFARETAFELRPVYLVMPEAGKDAGYLVFGSSPEPELAAQYATSLGASHALVATYRDEAGRRALDASLVDAGTRAAIAKRMFTIPAGALAQTEADVARWLVDSLHLVPSVDVSTPVTVNEEAYAALLEAMDEEVNATLLRASDAPRSAASLRSALARYVHAARDDPESTAAEERLLVIAAEGLERGAVADEIHALEELVTVRPRSWRAQYILGQLRAETGDANGAIVAFEHARSLHALPDKDLVRLAELYANAGAPAPALAHLRRIAPTSDAYGAAQELLAIISFQRGELDAGREAFARAVERGTTSWELHASYGAALHARGDTAGAVQRYEDALAAAAGQGAAGHEATAAVRLNLARVLIASDDRDRALTELDRLLQADGIGDIAGHARRLRFGLREPALEQDLERAGQAALAGDAASLESARATFERALAVESELWEAHFGLGIVARQRGDARAAQSAFRRVLQLSPDQPDALHELGVALLMGEEIEAALRALDQAAALRPDDAAYLADAGFAHLKAGDLASARRRLERAKQLDAADPITKTYLDELARVEAARQS